MGQDNTDTKAPAGLAAEPRPCPFCGKTPGRAAWQGETSGAGHDLVWHARVNCWECSVEVTEEDGDVDEAQQAALNAWNTRAYDAEHAQMRADLERLTAAHESCKEANRTLVANHAAARTELERAREEAAELRRNNAALEMRDAAAPPPAARPERGGEDWGLCFTDERFMPREPAPPAASAGKGALDFDRTPEEPAPIAAPAAQPQAQGASRAPLPTKTPHARLP